MMHLLGSSKFENFLLKCWARNWSSDFIYSQIYKTSDFSHINTQSTPYIDQIL